MTAPLFEIVDGWSEEIGPFTLRGNGAPVNLSGMDVSLIIRSVKTGALITTTDRTRVDADQTTNTGHVFYTPEEADFAERATLGSYYTFRWKVIDGAGDIVFFPNGEADVIRVFPT